MAEVSVSQFAEVLKVPVDRLLVQLDQAGIKVSGPDARISDDAKLELLTHLRRSHGSDADSDGAPRKITLRRKTQSELKLASAPGGRAAQPRRRGAAHPRARGARAARRRA